MAGGGLSSSSGRFVLSEAPRIGITPTLAFKRSAGACCSDATLRRSPCAHGTEVHARCSRYLHFPPGATSAAKWYVRSAIERAANLDFSCIVMMNTENKFYAVDACQHELTIEQAGFIADIDACPRSQRPILDSGCLHPPRRDVPRRVGRRRLFSRHETHAIDQLQPVTATFSGASVSVPSWSSPAIRSASADAAIPSCDMSVA